MNGMFEYTVAGFVHRAVRTGNLKNRSGFWAMIPTALRLPNEVRDEQVIPGQLAYFTIWAYGPLATRIHEQPPSVGAWITARGNETRATPYTNGKGQLRASIDLIPRAIDLTPSREEIAALISPFAAERELAGVA